MFLLAAAVFFAIFSLNVILGSSGAGVFLSDISEMLCLFAAAIAFVIAILKRESAARQANENEKSE